MQNQQRPTVILEPPWWRCENGCKFRCGESKPKTCPVCRSANIEVVVEIDQRIKGAGMSTTQAIYGYFTDASQIEPVFDPGVSVPCPICAKQLDVVDVRTISLMVPGDSRSYFYRVHRSCHEPLTEQERIRIDGVLIDAIYQTRNTN